MNMMINRLQRFGRYRQLHTIISQETIKPSSPTPHPKTHVLPLVDSINPHHHMPFVFFYKNYNYGDINILKKSLSQCLTQYYPFAGRLLSPFAGHIDCTDEGVEFVEVSHDSRLDDFILKKEEGKSLRQLLPNISQTSPNLVEIQLNHFTGGGVAMVVSTSHKVADAFTMLTFVRQWAAVTRGGSPIKPYFISSPTSHNNVKMPDVAYKTISEVKYATRRLVFPNSKLNELKKKVISMGISVTNPPSNGPSRVEVLTSLIFKCAVDAATTNTGFFRPSSLFHLVNMRNKIFKNDPEKVGGNIITMVHEKMTDSREITLNEVVSKLRKGKMEIKERNVEEIGERWENIYSVLGADPNLQIYYMTSICGFPTYDVDFGWGKPVHVMFEIPEEDNKIVVFIDTPHNDGIEATLHLPEKDMVILEQDKELLEYVDG
ncbi:putative deacetylvindoline O-acetyltransferase [Helianthus annuus]|nr:putative deacetylvindoline O-acetyltransferase [Helianthus annuus]